MLGIIGAMEVEVKELREMMENPQPQTVAGMTFYQGTIKGKEVVVVRSGIGKVNAGLCSQILVDRYQVDGIINTGIAGSLRNEINIGARVYKYSTVFRYADYASLNASGKSFDGFNSAYWNFNGSNCPWVGNL